MKDALRSSWVMMASAWRTNPLKMTIAVVLTALSGVVWPVLAVALRQATNAVISHDVHAAHVAGALAGACAIGVLVLRHFAFIAYVEVTEVSVIALETEIIGLANGSARIDHHERPDYADKISILQNELSGLMEGMGGLLTMFSLALSLGLTGVLLAFVNPWLLLLPIAAVPPVLAAQRASRQLEQGKEAAATDTRQSWHLLRLATDPASAKELRVFRLQQEIQRRNADLWDRAGRTLMRAERRSTTTVALGQLVFGAAYIVSVLLVVRQAVAGRSQVGDVVLVITLAAQVNQEVSSALQELRNLQKIAYGFTRLRWLRALIASQQPPEPDAEMPDRIRTGIELHDVAFRYPGSDRAVLADASVLLPAGSTVALVGENGAGKTSLVKLLCRFYEATSGTITIDGIDIQRLPIEAWRARIAAGFQDFVRFELTAQQTVGVGDLPDLDDPAAVHAALERARSTDVIDRLDEGLATPLGKTYREGTELSGGQWQKLALGRSMMREAPLLLILDEPTAALDAEAEHRLFERYAANAQRVGAETGAITVLVSHRFSTVRMADLILVVADGRIAEAGDHQTLLAAGGLYAELYGLQAAAFG